MEKPNRAEILAYAAEMLKDLAEMCRSVAPEELQKRIEECVVIVQNLKEKYSSLDEEES